MTKSQILLQGLFSPWYKEDNSPDGYENYSCSCIFPNIWISLIDFRFIYIFQGPIALRAAKKAINTGNDTDLATGLTIEQMCYASVSGFWFLSAHKTCDLEKSSFMKTIHTVEYVYDPHLVLCIYVYT